MKTSIIALGLLMAGLPLLAADDAASLRLPDGRTCFFAGSKISIPVEVRRREAGGVRLSWALLMHDAVVARREISLDLPDGTPTIHTLELELPETREGIAIAGLLRLSLTDPQGQLLKSIESPLHVFDPDPFVDRKKWLEDLELHVYDPEGATVAVFETAGIPFRRITNPAAFETAAGGILIIGEGLSLRASRGLVDAVLQAAQSGVPVVVLAPVEGEFQLPGMGKDADDAPARRHPMQLSFHGKNIITKLDKRLDAERWAADHDNISRYFRIGAHRDRPEIVVDENQGWPWIAVDWAGGKRARFCGFGIIRDWEASLVSRYLLAAILEQIQPREGKAKEDR